MPKFAELLSISKLASNIEARLLRKSISANLLKSMSVCLLSEVVEADKKCLDEFNCVAFGVVLGVDGDDDVLEVDFKLERADCNKRLPNESFFSRLLGVVGVDGVLNSFSDAELSFFFVSILASSRQFIFFSLEFEEDEST